MKSTLIVLGLIAAGISQAVMFDWESISLGVSTSFSQTVGGLTATVTGVSSQVTSITASGGAANLPFGLRSVCGGVATPSNSWRPTRIDFSSTVTGVTAWFGDNGPDDDGTVTLSAYNANNILIGSSSIVRGTTLPAQSLTVNAVGIAYVIGTTNATPNGHSVVWDNVSTVPEPATMAVFGLGAATLLRRRKK